MKYNYYQTKQNKKYCENIHVWYLIWEFWDVVQYIIIIEQIYVYHNFAIKTSITAIDLDLTCCLHKLTLVSRILTINYNLKCANLLLVPICAIT